VDSTARATLSTDLCRMKDGDRAAARPVFDALWPVLLTFARRSLDDDGAEEAAQRTLIRLFGQVDRYDDERDALSWAFALAVWEVRSVQRDAARARDRVDDTPGLLDDIAASGRTADAATSDHELRALLDVAIESLTDVDRRTLLELLDDADPRAPLTARLRQRRHRATARLRNMWRDLHGTP
jgi:RNA polymerase sigma-70 factor (ECF subfamily)